MPVGDQVGLAGDDDGAFRIASQRDSRRTCSLHRIGDIDAAGAEIVGRALETPQAGERAMISECLPRTMAGLCCLSSDSSLVRRLPMPIPTGSSTRRLAGGTPLPPCGMVSS